MEYYGLTKAIPKHWLTLIKPKNILEQNNLTREQLTFTINKRIKPLFKIQSQDIYWELISDKVEQPSALNVWLDLFPFLESINWDEIFERIFLITNEPALQSFQYKVINRIINCKYNLFKWKITNSPLCTYCSTVDTIDHHLFSCQTTQKFWQEVTKWTEKKLKVKLNFTTCEILFGIPFHGDINLHIINKFIIHGKQYLNNRKCNSLPIIFNDFLNEFKMKVKALCNLYKQESTNTKKVEITLKLGQLL